MDLYRKVRLACAEGMSQREAARHFNISRDIVAKMMTFSVPPGYRRKAPVNQHDMKLTTTSEPTLGRRIRRRGHWIIIGSGPARPAEFSRHAAQSGWPPFGDPRA